MKAQPVSGLVGNNLHPFMGVQFDKKLTFKVDGKDLHFRVFTYQAYNAFGLIGPEQNGIAIADDDNRSVVCDQIKRQGSGYFGASQEQFDEAERICAMEWDKFKAYVKAVPTLRPNVSLHFAAT